ncbi:glycosyltransferase family protein [Roseiflexus castenholzii]|uniref:Glycosyltransferase RgtA/B/C/D-like domain-containing protein n=1 Tax=Roseiflexus castenholzii (strain DSM 13941 / HLO8) TaxID=383372 RepID=A7NJW1_ROSCS|nr:hypothetical protein [Roseiflexus castenholzii]ABU57781.1 hypothetical protein Rcas_1689 [Roseiflexus castenholzii DSM 13941]
MTIVILIFIVLTLILIGAIIAHALPVACRADDPLERYFEYALIGALLNGWLAFTLAQIGAFSALLHAAIIAVLCLIALRIGRRHAPNTPTTPADVWRRCIAWVRQCTALPLRERSTSLLLVVLLLVFALLVSRPFETIIGVRDAGVYANAGFIMARTGSLTFTDSVVAQIAADQQSSDPEIADAARQAETNFLGVQNPQRFIATRLRAAGFFIDQGDLARGRVVPQGFHLFPAWIGLIAAFFGLRAGLLAPAVTGLLGIWSVAMLTRRLAGPWVALVAALFLTLNAVQVWFSRYTTAETAAQFLVFAGLYAFAAAFGHSMANVQRTMLLALLAGLAFGQLALTRIEFFLVLGPVALYLLHAWLARRWTLPHTALLAGIGAMVLHAGLHIAFLARAYFFDTLFARLQDFALTAAFALPFLTPTLRQVYLLRPCSRLTMQPCPPIAGMPPTADAPLNWTRIGIEALVVVVVVAALVAIRRLNLIARVSPLLVRLNRPLRLVAAIAIIGIGGYAYLIRPQILSLPVITALPACLAPEQLTNPQGACLTLQGYVGAPIATPAYVDPLAAWFDRAIGAVRGRAAPPLDACIALRRSTLPPTADGRTIPEVLRDGLLDETDVPPEMLATLRACDRYVLRDLFGAAQANLVRLGWYLSPPGIALALIGLALLAYRANSTSWLFLVIAAVASVVFLRLTYGTSDQHYIYIMRRYVPHVYPAFAIGAAYAIARLSFNVQPSTFHIPRSTFSRLILTLVLVLFLVVTGRPIYRHTEYAGALDQIGAMAGQFDPGAIVLMRGGAPSFAQARDIPDLLATPLTFAFGIDAFALKSRDPGRYAPQLARYIRRWHDQGRPVYLAIGASGAIALPEWRLEPAGRLHVDLPEYEQPTDHKPSAVQRFTLDFALYRLLPDEPTPAEPPALTIAPDDYAYQVRGVYRAERIGDRLIAWTDGDAIFRLPAPMTEPLTISVTLAAGARPATLPGETCLSLAAEPGSSTDEATFTAPVCTVPGAEPLTITLSADPRNLPRSPTGHLLLRVQTPPFIPARDDPASHDPRRLGVQIVALAVRSAPIR